MSACRSHEEKEHAFSRLTEAIMRVGSPSIKATLCHVTVLVWFLSRQNFQAYPNSGLPTERRIQLEIGNDHD
ncbi:hypothetical protein BDR04DRAFT_1088380 [Suillus decipiens]|nr:hypothetical protein BDR04DRAFT_1088380 [Suillus decipiens]